MDIVINTIKVKVVDIFSSFEITFIKDTTDFVTDNT